MSPFLPSGTSGFAAAVPGAGESLYRRSDVFDPDAEDAWPDGLTLTTRVGEAGFDGFALTEL